MSEIAIANTFGNNILFSKFVTEKEIEMKTKLDKSEFFDEALEFIRANVDIINLANYARYLKLPEATLNSVVYSFNDRYGKPTLMPDKYKSDFVSLAINLGFGSNAEFKGTEVGDAVYKKAFNHIQAIRSFIHITAMGRAMGVSRSTMGRAMNLKEIEKGTAPSIPEKHKAEFVRMAVKFGCEL